MLKRTAVTVVSVLTDWVGLCIIWFQRRICIRHAHHYVRGDEWTKRKKVFILEKTNKSTHTKMKNSKSKRYASKKKGKEESRIWVKVKWMCWPFDVYMFLYTYTMLSCDCVGKMWMDVKNVQSNERKRDNAINDTIHSSVCIWCLRSKVISIFTSNQTDRYPLQTPLQPYINMYVHDMWTKARVCECVRFIQFSFHFSHLRLGLSLMII